MRAIVFGLAIFGGASAARAEGFDLSGTIRLRYETIANQPRAGFNRDDDLVNLRTTVLARYADGPLELAGELYDSRVYAEDAGPPVTTNEVNALELVQVYAAYTLSKAARVQAGRFLLNLGSRRLVAADDYRNTTNGYTGLRADFTLPGVIKATAIYTLPQVRLPDDRDALRRNGVEIDRESFDLVLWGGLASKADVVGGATIEASYFHLGERDGPGRATRDRSLDSFGVRIIREPATGQLDFEAEAIVQRGEVSASVAPGAATRDVSAWFVHADLGYQFSSGWRPRISIEYDHASGDKGGGRFNRFDTLFGMRRADLAPAGLYNAVGRANIMTPAVRVEATPSKRVDVFAVYRLMWLASRSDAFSTTGVRDASGRSGRFAGWQAEARVRWWVRPERLRAEVNAVWLGKGRFLETASNAPDGGDTRYLSLNLTATF